MNHFSSTKYADWHPSMTVSLLFITSIVVLKATRSEGIVVWQQLMPLQLPAFTTILASQMDMHPPITEPELLDSTDTIEAKLLQPMAMNLFLDWEKTKELFAKFTIFAALLEPFVQLKNVG
jgi:hypothetical protein